MQYRAYGLSIHSEIPLPELTPHASDEPEVRIVLGGVPDRLEAAAAERVTWAARPGEWLQDIEGVGRYYVRDGCEVRVEPSGPDADVRAFLFSSTWGALLHQRGLFVLHASAIRAPGGAVAFTGPSGAGKSTLLAALLRRGYPMLADDKVAVTTGPEGPCVLPGYPALRLWRDTLERLGLAPESLARLRGDLDKYVYPSPAFHDRPAPLRAVYVLGIHREAGARIEGLDAVEAFGWLRRRVYRKQIVDGIGRAQDAFRQATALAAGIPVARLLRPEAGDSAEAVADALEADLRRLTLL